MAYLGGFGSNATKTVGATLAITASSTIPAGTLLVLGVSWDNIDAATPTISTVSASGGGTWTSRGTANVGVSATAGSGIFAAVYTTLTTSQINSGATITTITFSSASTASKAAAIVGLDNMIQSIRGSVISATSTGGAPSAVTTTAPVTGDVVIGVIHGEDNATPTGDADTLNGSWSAIYGTASTGAGAATNMAIGIQAKTVTAGGNQTYNATTANDAVAFVFTLATPIAATLSGQSTASGNFAPTITYVPQMTGTSSSQNPPAQTTAAIGIKTTATASGNSVSSGNLPAPTLVNTFVLDGFSTSSGSTAMGLVIKMGSSGASTTAGTFTPTIAYVPLLTGQSNSTGAAQIRSLIRSTLSGQSTTTGSLAAFRAVGVSGSGQAASSGTGAIKATLAPIMIGQSNSNIASTSITPVFTFRPVITGQSNATGSFRVGLVSPGTMSAFAFSYGAATIGQIIRNNSASGESDSSGSANVDLSLSTSFIGWGTPL
jgi:hypothetical protein